MFISFQGFLDLIVALRFLERGEKRSDFLKRPQKSDEISQLIWILLNKRQIFWLKILSKNFGLLRKPEL